MFYQYHGKSFQKRKDSIKMGGGIRQQEQIIIITVAIRKA